jgi:phosphopantothenoylcysteine decarboxylase / phosphopantothenate---cysteine ligase
MRSKVLLGVTGGIAAYKAPELVRRLRESGFEVRCALTPAACAFVSPLALEVVSGSPVYGEEYLRPSAAGARHGGEELHIAAAGWADLLLIAPATAHSLASLALGLADNFLLTTALAYRGPVVVAPAMHAVMWEQPALRARLAELVARGVEVVGPGIGALASGEVGVGRMAEVDELVRAVRSRLGPPVLPGRRVLVTAGPTFEPIDPVRFLGNRSSGKMGFALAAAAARAGASVRLVAGPSALATPPGVERVDVETALEMEQAVRRWASEADLVVMAAAVADFRPRRPAPGKLKKSAGPPELDLVPNPDILALLAELAPRALRVGFAAETGDLETEAARKLAAKDAHLLVANDVSRAGIGFGSDDNEVAVLWRDGRSERLPRMSKDALAAHLVNLFAEELAERNREPIPVAP